MRRAISYKVTAVGFYSLRVSRRSRVCGVRRSMIDILWFKAKMEVEGVAPKHCWEGARLRMNPVVGVSSQPQL